MKIKTIILLTIISIIFLSSANETKSQLQSNWLTDNYTKSNKQFLIKAPKISIEDLINLKVEELKRLGNDFKYFNELNSGEYIVQYDSSHVFIIILQDKISNNLIEQVSFNSARRSILSDKILETIECELSEEYDQIIIKDFDKYLNEKSFWSKQNNNFNDNSNNLQHIFKDRVFIDQEILNLSQYNSLYPDLGKILNRRKVMERVNDPTGADAQLFADITAGTVIQLPIGVGKPKVFIVDKVWDRIIMMDRDIIGGEQTIAYAYPQYGNYSLFYPTDITSGAKRFSNPNSVVVDSIVSLYIADYGNNRIIRLDYVMQYNYFPSTDEWLFTTSYIRDQSFRILVQDCDFPHSIAIHPGVNGNPRDSTDDILWYSEGLSGNQRLVCVNAMTGQFIQEVRNLRTVSINPSRISIYRSPDGQKNLLGFIDEESNLLGILKLEPNGTFLNSDINVRYLQNFGDVKLKSVLLTSSNTELDKTTIWTVGDMGPGDCFGGAHCGVVSTLKINFLLNNFPANVEYLASSWQGYNSSSSFVNLQNLYAEKGYLDIATMEKWDDNFGIRRYKPGIDIVSSEISPYCYPAEYCTYTVKLTNPARVKFKGQYKPINGQWSDYQIYVNNFGPDPTIMLPSGTNQLTIRRVQSTQYLTEPEQIKVIAQYLPSDETDFGNNSHKITLEKTADFSDCSSGGGCPYLYVNNGIGFVQDNNILHRSEFDENIGLDIEDKYLLRVTPFFNAADSTCSLKIKELNNDVSYFDRFSLVAVDHPAETNLGITETNNYVLYFPSAAMSPNYAVHNEEDVTGELNYDSNYTKIVRGVADDEVTGSYGADNNSLRSNSNAGRNKLINSSESVFANYKTAKKNKSQTHYDHGITDSVAVIFDPSVSDIPPTIIGPPIKRPAGNVIAQDESAIEDPVAYDFAKRQNTSPVIISVGQNVNIDSVLTEWYSDFLISYLALTPVYYGGYDDNALTLVNAQDSVNGNVLNSLLSVDTNYAVMDSLTNITLNFKNTFGNAPAGYVRSYVLITNGRYEKVTESDHRIVSSHGNQNLSLPIEYKLHQNYPNPFNPVTTIKFDLPKDGLVNIKIFDILGKEIYSAVETKRAGYYQMNFNGSNFASGIYFYRIITGEFSSVKRMVLIK